MKSKIQNLLYLGLFLFGTLSFAQTTPVPNPVAKLDKVIWVWLENVPFIDLSNYRYTKSLWLNYPSVRFTSYAPVSLITQANTFAMISGSDLGILDNDLTRIFTPTVLDMLESKNIPWKAYAEDFPGSCYLGGGIGNYKRYRVPFLSVAQVQSDRYRCMKVVSFANLNDDIKNGSLPRFSVIIPNLLSSGAIGTPADADATLKEILNPIVVNPDLMQSTTIIISSVNNINPLKPEMFTMILGNGVSDYAMTVDTNYNHYNLLRTIEDGLILGNLNQHDAKADPMVGFWK